MLCVVRGGRLSFLDNVKENIKIGSICLKTILLPDILWE